MNVKNLYPVFSFVVNNYGYGDKTTLWIVARDYNEAYKYLEGMEEYNVDMDYSDEYMSTTGYFTEVKDEHLEHLPYVDKQD